MERGRAYHNSRCSDHGEIYRTWLTALRKRITMMPLPDKDPIGHQHHRHCRHKASPSRTSG